LRQAIFQSPVNAFVLMIDVDKAENRAHKKGKRSNDKAKESSKDEVESSWQNIAIVAHF
ncbi:hypothetical protein BGX26_005435, partial [Mortierella sp. AD094]